MIESYIARLLEREDLPEKESENAMSLIMSGQATEAQIAGFLVALRMKGETIPEITGCARAMRDAALTIEPGVENTIDTCGTGGDTRGTFNISTAAAIVSAAADVPVAKHGNRSVSSSSGSADVLQTLGVNIEAPPAVVEECIRSVGIGFLFAPLLHKAMKYAIGPRRELAARTVFNLLGPLTNPAGVKRQLLGLYSGNLVEKIAGVLKSLGSEKALVVHSEDGLDELSVCGESKVAELNDGQIETYRISPEKLGLPRGELSDLEVESPEESAEVIRAVLSGRQGPQRDVVVLNAGAAIYIGGKSGALEEGIETAANAIDSGQAEQTLQELVKVSYQ
ncbi:MAG: anthranilate phosphoribosyltransferase [Candidatus Brocadiia bacterium]